MCKRGEAPSLTPYGSFEKGPPQVGHLSEFTKPEKDLQLGQYAFAVLVFPFGSGSMVAPQFEQRISSVPTTAIISDFDPHLGHL